MAKCPYCDYISTNHETLDGQDNPKVGEVSFCINCGEISRFTKTRLKKVSLGDLTYSEKTEVREIRDTWEKIKRVRRCLKCGISLTPIEIKNKGYCNECSQYHGDKNNG